MKAIMISDKPKWCALMMNGKKNIEVRTSKALAKAIQKLIDEQGFADIYVCCTKDNKGQLHYSKEYGAFYDIYKGPEHYSENGNLNGKVVFKFRCYKVEEISWQIGVFQLEQRSFSDFLNKCCLGFCEFKNYLNKKNGYAIHISDLQIFDRPKELNEFRNAFKYKRVESIFGNNNIEKDERTGGVRQPVKGGYEYVYPLTKAPQNFTYIEVE